MKSIVFTHRSQKSVTFWWKYLSDIDNYEKIVPFISNVEVYGPLQKGSNWWDKTRVLFIPMRTNHIIAVWEEKKKIVFTVPNPGGGEVRETFSLRKTLQGTIVSGMFKIDVPCGLLPNIISWILAKRLRIMLQKTVENIEKQEETLRR